MAFRMSEQPRTIKIYNLLAGTNEFIGEGDAYIPPHTGLPANSTDIAPPDIPAGFVAVFNSDESSWHLVEDFHLRQGRGLGRRKASHTEIIFYMSGV